ncbi:zinc finger protein 33A-like [Topomyia yanbarensis]|uniref:zinc finger protein 33A-like n=1 Tax=Topomyia yanbarensis TaxID=2498891 RepID=UPI00273C3F9A|nr:zinc finger protein 33A-like [Topomyia yanbarensis]
MDFEKICRLCCEIKCPLYSIHMAYGIYSPQQFFGDILRLELSPDDGLPQKLCEMCLSTITKMQETIETFRDNDRMLRLQQYGQLVQVDIKEEIFDIDEIEQATTRELQIDIIDEKIVEDDKDIGDLKQDDEKVDEEWLQSETENKSDDMLEEKSPPKKPRRKTQTKKREVGGQKIPRGRKGGRPRTRFRDPNFPRLHDYRCYICKSESLGTAEALLVHLDSHLNEVPYTCTECVLETVVINKVTTLNIHKRMHENPHKCPHCDRRYSNKGAIDTHVQTYHLGENAPCPSPCEQCGKVCSSKSALKYHLRMHINGNTCEICGKTFVAQHKLRRHIERKHEKLKKYECHLCHKKLCSLDSVHVHIKTMHSSKEVKCEYCGKSYPSEFSLRYHLKKHEQDPNSKFSRDWKEYYTFVEAEEGTKPENRLKKCNLCGAVLKSIGHHMRSMHFPTEYRCTICGVVYKRKSTLETHILEHEHGKAYRCPICGKECSEKKNFIAHLKTKKHRDHPLAQSLDWLDTNSASVPEVQVKKYDSDSEQSDSSRNTMTSNSYCD